MDRRIYKIELYANENEFERNKDFTHYTDEIKRGVRIFNGTGCESVDSHLICYSAEKYKLHLFLIIYNSVEYDSSYIDEFKEYIFDIFPAEGKVSGLNQTANSTIKTTSVREVSKSFCYRILSPDAFDKETLPINFRDIAIFISHID